MYKMDFSIKEAYARTGLSTLYNKLPPDKLTVILYRPTYSSKCNSYNTQYTLLVVVHLILTTSAREAFKIFLST